MKTIEFKAIEFDNAHEAIQHAEAGGGEAVLVHGRHMVVDSDTLDMLNAAGTEFAYLCNHAGRIVTVPVGD